MVVGSIVPHAEYGSNDHREEAPHFIFFNRKEEREEYFF